MNLDVFQNKRVLVTGHTGFKGSWLTLLLDGLGAEVFGFALPSEELSLFEDLQLSALLGDRHFVVDVRDAGLVRERVLEVRPDFVFHLAAQPLVRPSYADPLGTFATNVMGTLHVLEALRSLEPNHCVAAVMVTTDKVYENQEWDQGYRENDPLGGYDPYSASKGACEIGIASMRRSFFGAGNPHPGVAVASARAGNVIGGGDWAKDRIFPDCMRMLAAGAPIPVRNPRATRPWQHVLDPLAGYLRLAASLYDGIERGDLEARDNLEGAFNFGPALAANRSVKELVEAVLRHWPGQWVDQSDPQAVHEASLLHLQIDKAWHRLGWRPRWGFEQAVEATVAWYRAKENGTDMREFTEGQVGGFFSG